MQRESLKKVDDELAMVRSVKRLHSDSLMDISV